MMVSNDDAREMNKGMENERKRKVIRDWSALAPTAQLLPSQDPASGFSSL